MMRKIAPIAASLLLACGAEDQPRTQTEDSELALARALEDACPKSSAGDANARDTCAARLADIIELRDHVADPLLWGGQPKDMPIADVPENAHLTEFNPFVWRRMYLSTFMFESAAAEVTVEGNYRVLRMPIRFRNDLDAGDYPYPFWHSEKKWKSYETATHLYFFFKDDKIVAAVRSAETDASRPHADRVWDGAWTWSNGAEPRVTLYRYLFSADNPHVERLETAYRNFSDTMREQNCTSCHDPANNSMMRKLELLNYPNQALSGRHDLARVLEANLMPPGVGIEDLIERVGLTERANEFALAGDEALLFEGEPVPARD